MGSRNLSESGKVSWSGRVISIQPRIRLTRSFDQRTHSYLGYTLTVRGLVGGEERTFMVGVGKEVQAKQQFESGDIASGRSGFVEDTRTEVAEYYKTSELKLTEKGSEPRGSPPPWLGMPPRLEVYRQRGHRRLDSRTYGTRCGACIWGCRMLVEMIIDQWNPGQRRYRFETFCYGPKSCSFYRAGPTRKVPGRQGMMWEEEDWVDEEAVSHRGMDE